MSGVSKAPSTSTAARAPRLQPPSDLAGTSTDAAKAKPQAPPVAAAATTDSTMESGAATKARNTQKKTLGTTRTAVAPKAMSGQIVKPVVTSGLSDTKTVTAAGSKKDSGTTDAFPDMSAKLHDATKPALAPDSPQHKKVASALTQGKEKLKELWKTNSKTDKPKAEKYREASLSLSQAEKALHKGDPSLASAALQQGADALSLEHKELKDTLENAQKPLATIQGAAASQKAHEAMQKGDYATASTAFGEAAEHIGKGEPDINGTSNVARTLQKQTAFCAKMQSAGVTDVSMPPSQGQLQSYFKKSFGPPHDAGKAKQATKAFGEYASAFHVHNKQATGEENLTYNKSNKGFETGPKSWQEVTGDRTVKSNVDIFNSGHAGKYINDCEGFAFMADKLLGKDGAGFKTRFVVGGPKPGASEKMWKTHAMLTVQSGKESYLVSNNKVRGPKKTGEELIKAELVEMYFKPKSEGEQTAQEDAPTSAELIKKYGNKIKQGSGNTPADALVKLTGYTKKQMEID